MEAITLPMAYTAVGLVASLLGIFLMRILAKGDPGRALRNVTFIAAGLFLALAYFVTQAMPLDDDRPDGVAYPVLGPFWFAVLAGSLAGIASGW
jgi:K(+)-stimulated pyrophosphate-energized sodium pump